MRTALFASALTLALFGPASADVQERYAELQAVPEAINDPDPLMRLALLEAIVAEGDATKVQLALRTAFTVDDPNVRALALRAHLATYKTLILTAEIPEAAKAEIETNSNSQIYRDYLSLIKGLGFQFVIEIGTDDISGIEFPVMSMNNLEERNRPRHQGAGNVRGSSISIRAPFYHQLSFHTCSFELHEYDGFEISGTGSCDQNGGAFPLHVVARLF